MKKIMSVILTVALTVAMTVPAFAAKDKMVDTRRMSHSYRDCYDWAVSHYDDKLWDMPEVERYNYIVDYVKDNVKLLTNEEVMENQAHRDPALGFGDTFSMTSCIAELSRLAGLEAKDLRYDVSGNPMGVSAVTIEDVTYYTDIWFYVNGSSDHKFSTTRWVTHKAADEFGPVAGGDCTGGLGFTAADLLGE